MKIEDKTVIREKIATALNKGELSLLLGAGFSIVNSVGSERLPDGEALKTKLLEKCGKSAGPKTNLKDAYQFAKRSISDFDKFFAECFMVDSTYAWQQKLFEYVWARIYTTNIDNVLNIAFQVTSTARRNSGEFRFFNYVDEGLISDTIGTIPVISIHGTCLKLKDGFIFSSLEYAKASSKVLDWHNDLAARIIAGGVVVVGNQLDESDIDTYVSRRQETYGEGISPENWLVGPNPDPIKAENWKSAGFYVIDATAEEFFEELYKLVKPRTIGDIVFEVLPSARRALNNVQAITWFKSAFSLVFDQIEIAFTRKGILKHFITGADPEWLYIVNNAHAETERGTELTAAIANLLSSNALGVGILHVVGPSGSGKTTAIRNSLQQLVRTYRYVYEFESNQNMEKTFLRNVIENFTEKSIFVFYSAADYYFAVKEIADRFKDRDKPYCLFVLEDRTNDYQKNKRQLHVSGISPQFVEFGDLRFNDARNIAQKIDDAGLKFEKFSEYEIDARARIILDKEKGFSGDLLSALFSLTTHENFEEKLFQDYQSAGDGLARSILDLVAILHFLGFSVPIDYVAGSLNEKLDDVSRCVSEELAGVVVIPNGTSVLKCRHRVIASYYFENNISGKGDAVMLIGLLEYLSRKFSVDDIRLNPLPFRIYRDVISFEFLYDRYFPKNSRRENSEHLYHEAQRFFIRDGLFWLQFGRFYRKVGRLKEAIDCFRTGLEFFESFQTRHALGMTLLEHYLITGDYTLYEEGVSILEAERRARGEHDAYPTAALLKLLTDVLRKDPKNTDAQERCKACFNVGMKHFRNDEFFKEIAEKYMRVLGNN